jgi:Ca2+-binding EF-hand superfamily protein
MDVVTQVESLSMKWCLDCHREPAANIRPKEFVTALDWNPSPTELREIYDQQLEKGFGRLDLDSDGALSFEETRSFLNRPESLDQDRDQKLTKDELQAGTAEVDRTALGRLLLSATGTHPTTNCSTCHR